MKERVLSSLTYNERWKWWDALIIQNGEPRRIMFFGYSKTKVLKRLRSYYDVVCPKTAINIG